jgi:SM-20-related protein
MPSPNLFTQLGFFVRRQFLDPECCLRLMAEASDAPGDRGRLVRRGVDNILDEDTRRTTSALVDKATRIRVKQRFLETVPELEAHFGTTLDDCETPGFLIYEPGAFFAAHRDVSPDDSSEIHRRVISAIVFLNAAASEPSSGEYGGGTLRFHHLLDGPQWEACPLSFEPEPGMMVAFRSDVLHEVEPVTSGRRFTIVTWFLDRETSQGHV